MPVRGCSAKVLSKADNQPGVTSVSLFRKTRYLPRAVSAPRLQEAMKPEFCFVAQINDAGYLRDSLSVFHPSSNHPQ